MEWVIKILLGIVCLIIIGTLALLPIAIKNDNRLMAECMKDKKEYECQAMLRSGGGNSNYVPVIIGR